MILRAVRAVLLEYAKTARDIDKQKNRIAKKIGHKMMAGTTPNMKTSAQRLQSLAGRSARATMGRGFSHSDLAKAQDRTIKVRGKGRRNTDAGTMKALAGKSLAGRKKMTSGNPFTKGGMKIHNQKFGAHLGKTAQANIKPLRVPIKRMKKPIGGKVV